MWWICQPDFPPRKYSFFDKDAFIPPELLDSSLQGPLVKSPFCLLFAFLTDLHSATWQITVELYQLSLFLQNGRLTGHGLMWCLTGWQSVWALLLNCHEK